MRRYRPFSYCCIRPISTRSLTTTTIYPCHSAGGTVRAFTGVRPPFIQGSFLRLICPLLTPVTLWAPLAVRSLVVSAICRVHLFVFPDQWAGLVRAMTRNVPDARVLFYRFPLIFRHVSVAVPYETQRASRGKHVSFRTRAPSIRAWPIVVRGLCPVLRTRPTRPASLDFCSSPRAFAVPCRSKATASPGPLPGTRL